MIGEFVLLFYDFKWFGLYNGSCGMARKIVTMVACFGLFGTSGCSV